MKLVRCDKCGKTMRIGLVDSDYVVEDDDGIVAYDNPNSIIERNIAGKTLDVCNICYSALEKIKERAEENFVADLAPQKECGYGTTNKNV